MRYVGPEEDAALFQPMLRTGWRFYVLLGALLTVVVWGVSAYYRQLTLGLGVTGLNRPVFWGVYIVNFVFFIGLSHAGILISAILRIVKAEWRRPFTRAAEAITLFSLPFGAGSIIIDLGRPERLLNVMASAAGVQSDLSGLGALLRRPRRSREHGFQAGRKPTGLSFAGGSGD